MQVIPLVSIVVPCFNEAAGIANFHTILNASISALADINWEILCVDDGSTDGTLAALLALAEHDPRMKIVELSRNFGKEAALTAGLDAARGDAVIPL
ncbi:MAG: glycosyltransferase, partial [Acidocella sp. 20-61-6]